MRRLLVVLPVTVLIAILVLVAAYVAVPSLISAASPLIAERQGLRSLDIVAERPTLRNIVIRQIDAATASVTASATGVTVEYTPSGLRRGVVRKITIDRLTVTVSAGSGTADAGETAPPGVPELPLDRLVVSDLSLNVPAAGFSGAGSATLSGDALDVELNGLTPEAASRFSLRAGLDGQGMYSARFFDREQQGEPFVAITGSASEETVTIDAVVDLRGYALELVSTLLELPEGRGNVAGRITTELGWPLPEAIEWQSLSAEVPELTVAWQSTTSPLAVEAATSGVTIAGGDISGSVRGRIMHNTAGADIRIDIEEDLPFNYSDGMLRADNGSIDIAIARDEDSVNAVIRSLSAGIAGPPRVQATAELDAMTAGVHTQGELRIGVEIEPARERIDGDLTLDATTEVAGIRRPVALSADFSYVDNDLSMSGSASSGVIQNMPISLSHDLEDGGGSAGFEYTMRPDRPLLGSVLDDWDGAYDLTGGTLAAEGEARWASTEPVTAWTRINLSNGTAFHGETNAAGIETELALSWNDAAKPLEWRLEPAWIRVAAIDVGFPITNLATQFARDSGPLSFRSTTAEVLGGDLTVEPFEYDLDTGSTEMDVRLTDVSLAQLLALEGEDITGSGSIDALIPVRLADNAARVENGTFEAQPPGGTIAIASSFAPQSGQPGLDFALRALTDFRYTGLAGNVDYSENGDLQLAIRLDGNNPAIEQGRAIRYNLNISENVPALLESLRLSDRFTERLQEGVND